MATFSATIANFAAMAKEAQDRVFREALEDTVAEVDARVPVDIGFLRNSQAADANGQGQFNTTKPINNGDTGGNNGEASLVIAGLVGGDIAHIAWTAAYARRVNSGFSGQDSLGRTYNQGGRHYLEGGAGTWQKNVEAAILRNKL